MSCRNVIGTGLLTIGLLGVLFSQSNGKPAPQPKFNELSQDDQARLEQQRVVIATAAKKHGGGILTRKTADLPLLQKLIDDGVFKKSQTYELQCLGVAFGDVLASDLPLRWVMVTDEFGTDPTLRFKETTIQVNVLTMISKRFERDEKIDLSRLLLITREQLSQFEGKLGRR